jgi:uncharacterized membrane protein
MTTESGSPRGRRAGSGPGPKRSGSGAKAALGLAALLAVAGIAHFARPKPFDVIVPRVLPGRARSYTYASGAAELGIATLVAVPKTRRLGGLLAALLFVAVFPANVQMAIDWRHASLAKRLIAFGRLPLQLPLILWAWRVRNRAER